MSNISAIIMPRWGLTMEEGTVTGWLVSVGDSIQLGGDIVDVESSKLSGTVEAPATGILRRQTVTEGQSVPTGALLGVITDQSTTESEIDEFVQSFKVVAPEQTDDEAVLVREIDVNGHKFSYLRMGDAPKKVLLIHGFGGDAPSWGYVQQSLSSQYDTIALDLLGHGGSSKSVPDGSLAGQSGNVAAFINALELDNVHVVGHSMGAGIALALALSRPDLVSSLTLLAPVSLGGEINADYLKSFIKAEKRRDLEAVLRQLFHDASAVNRALVDDVMKYKRLDGVTEALQTILSSFAPEGVQRDIWRDRLGDMKIPVTIVWGKNDQIVPSSHVGGLESIANVILIENVGHMPQVERPDQVIAAVKETIERAI